MKNKKYGFFLAFKDLYKYTKENRNRGSADRDAIYPMHKKIKKMTYRRSPQRDKKIFPDVELKKVSVYHWIYRTEYKA